MDATTVVSRSACRQAHPRSVIAAARQLIAERGLDALRVSDVTDRADVAFGTFYNQFKTEAGGGGGRGDLWGRRGDRAIGAFADPGEALVASASGIVRIAYDDPT
ncbi:hypothetical protein TUM20985_40040 [Mycobacterium antarcticum]|uniref:TetR/AcrR family transcriptional regulator n=1 Tax=unclassified Mycolicibacterium TaxID=2636767 RepID=UPI0023A37184|nr:MULTISPECIES: helix-turn-helix domain-containing protein [unclassified Mycolicibacterium]BDX33457.1 hypothetical protein TUM20985_40040 [Mycolicibacterium sp. TUM20985]GLP82930.1 hypothetical protein TUM20984_43500 [Mycolicibacterium sp. TUM20984]